MVQHGVQYLLATVLLGGLIMLAFGLLRLGKLVRMVPHPVMLGFVNGLAIIIALAQLEHFKSGDTWLSGTPLYIMIGLVAVTMAIVYVLPRLTRAVPPALAAILGVGLAVYLLGLPTRTLGDMAHIAGGLPAFALPDIPWSLETLRIIAPYAILMALVGLLETLLTLNLTDEITESRGYPDRECMALGAANMVSGVFGGDGWLRHDRPDRNQPQFRWPWSFVRDCRGCGDSAVHPVSVAADRAHSIGRAGRGDVRCVAANLRLGLAASSEQGSAQ